MTGRVLFGLVAAGGFGLFAVGATDGPVPPATPNPGVAAGTEGCRACHSGADQRGARGFVGRFRSHEFVRLDESVLWDEQDPHSRAFQALTGDRGRQMAAVLGYPVHADARCLTCHAVDTGRADPKDRFHTAEGVTCNACHGLGERWQAEHWRGPAGEGPVPPWRTKTPNEKSAAGMTDLRNPAVKAAVCASCHVGDPAAGKVVTHEMYAAGHPPLPPFELAAFLDGQPRHWAAPDTLAYFRTLGPDPKRAWDLYRFHPDGAEVAAARDLAAGAVAALRAEAAQLAADAGRHAEADWEGVDYARFDCYACHHDLKVPSDRQARGYPDRAPGRPPLKAWVAALPGVAAGHAAGLPAGGLDRLGVAFPGLWKRVQAAAVARPFGDPKALAGAAADLIKWCDAVSAVLRDHDQPIYSPEQARDLAARVAAAADAWAADPEAAMHLTWAYTALRRGAGDPAPADRLAAVDGVVPVAVRAGPFALGGTPTPIDYATRMRAVREFRADPFRLAFRAMAGR
jgi:hypothetical protein